ncbi:MAG: hypothetical protein H0T60_10865 [Acidobacteria bacterium]|nr:hypothetical protein [Acidobacteriota bacterium]
MKKYRVLVRGENLLLAFEEGPRRMGFYTTRFVEAAGPEEAESAIVESLRQDGELGALVLNQPDDTPLMYVEEIEEVGSLRDASGFSFYPYEA